MAVGFQPFSSAHADDDRDERDERGVSKLSNIKGLLKRKTI